MKKTRLDELCINRGLFPDRAAVQRAVIAGDVRVDDACPQSPAMLVSPSAIVTVKERMRYVSRGGYKLEGALAAFGQDVGGLHCLDAGASTGGFTDCLLQAGAARVCAVDVGYGQLDWRLRQDPRVDVRERTNIRTASPASLGAPFDLLVADLSFIGLAALAPAFAALVDAGGIFIGLIKPQFESQHDETNAGLVESDEVRQRTIHEVEDALEQAGFKVTGCVESSLRGKKKGNVEYLVRAIREEARTESIPVQ